MESKTRSVLNNDESSMNEIKLDRRFELPELCKIYLGRVGGYFYLLVVLFYLFLAQWMTGPMIGTGLTTNIPLNTGIFTKCTENSFGRDIHPSSGCWNTYALYVAIFTAIVALIACLELKEQAIFQVTISILRFCVILFMIGYSIVSIVSSVGEESYSHTSISNATTQDNDYTRFHLNGFLATIPVIVYAQMLQASIPSLTQSISNKSHLVFFYSTVFLAITLFYGAVGVAVALYKKNDVKQLCTANWEQLTTSEHSGIIRVLSFVVVLFPTLEALSGYSLTTLVMANMAESMCVKDPRRMLDRVTRAVHRFFWAVVPLIGSIYITNFVSLNKYAGLIGFFVVFWFPAILQYRSKQVSRALFLPVETPYTSWYSGNGVVLFLFMVGVVLTVTTFVGFMLPGSLS